MEKNSLSPDSFMESSQITSNVEDAKNNQLKKEVFNWDNDVINLDDVNDKKTEETEQEVETEEVEDVKEKSSEKEEVSSKKPKQEKRVDELSEEEVKNFFKDEDDSQETEDETSEKEEEQEVEDESQETPGDVKNALQILTDKGLLDLEEVETDGLDSDEILEEAFTKAVDKSLAEVLSELPSEIKNLVKYHAEGGDIASYFNSLKENSAKGLSTSLDISKDENQKAVMKAILSEEGYDEDEIEDQIEHFKDSGKLKIIAEKKYNAWKSKEEARVKEELEQESLRKESLKKQEKQLRNNLVNKLESSKEIGEFTLSADDKKNIPSYLHDKKVKLDNGNTISEFHKDLYSALQNQDTAIQLALILKKMDKKTGVLNFDSLKNKEKSKTTKNLKNSLRRVETTNNSMKKPKSLLDLL